MRVLKLKTAQFLQLGLQLLHRNMKGFTTTLLIATFLSVSMCLPLRQSGMELLKRGTKLFLYILHL